MNNAFFHLFYIAIEQGMTEDEAADYASMQTDSMTEE
jgi:hypothetical protein